MARPRKRGLEYFPVDVGFLEDVKVMRITSRCGPEAIAVLICLLGEIYAEEGYYIDLNEDTAFIIGQKCGLCEDKVLEIVDRAKETGFFDKKMAEKYHILTSRGIQERYIEATKKRKGRYIKKEFDVLTDTETPVSAPETQVTDTETPVSAPESTQSKVKKSKEEEEEEDTRAREGLPVDQDFASVIQELERCGFAINAYMADEVQDMLSRCSASWIVEAVRRATEYGGKSLAYIKRVLGEFEKAGCITDPSAGKRERPPNRTSPADDNIDWGEIPEEFLKGGDDGL